MRFFFIPHHLPSDSAKFSGEKEANDLASAESRICFFNASFFAPTSIFADSGEHIEFR